MTTALTPALALDYLRELSADFRTGAVLDARGELEAGDPGLLAHARELLAVGAGDATPGDREPTVFAGSTRAGRVFAARDENHAIVAVTGPFALPDLALHDLRTALSALGGRTVPIRVSAPVPDPLVKAFLEAAEEAFRRQRAN